MSGMTYSPDDTINRHILRQAALTLPGVGILAFDRELRCIFANGTLLKKVGFDPNVMLGHRPDELLTPEQWQGLAPYYERALAGSESDEFEQQVGSLVYRGRITALYDDAGAVIGCMAVAWDITEQRNSERIAHQQRVRLTLLNDIATGIRSGMSVNAVIEHAVRRIADYFPHMRAAYSIIDERGHLHVVTAVQPETMPIITGGAAVNLTVAPEYLAALKRHEIVAIADWQSDTRVVALRDVLASGGTSASLDVPLHHAGRLAGIICFDSPVPHSWDEHEIETLREVADYLVDAIEDAARQQERERVEADLRASRQFTEHVAATVPDIIYVHELQENHLVYTNREIGQMLGYTPEHVIGLGGNLFLTLMHPDDLERMPKHYYRLLSTDDGEIVEHEFRSKHADGSWRWLHTREVILNRSADGTPRQLLGIAYDVTERRVVEEELRHSRQRIALMLDAIPDLLFRIRGDGVFLDFRTPPGMLLFAAPAQIIGGNILDLLPSPVAEQALAATRRALESGERQPFEYVLPVSYDDPDEQHWFEARISVLADDEVLAIIRDITERRRAEARQLELALEREKVRALSEFIEVASHDFRTPLSILNTSAYLLRRITDPQQQTQRLDEIHTQVARLTKLIDQLLMMSSLNNSRQFNFAPVLPNSLLRDLEMYAARQNRASQVALRFEIADDLPVIHADAVKLFKVFTNLVDNAVRFTPAEGSVTTRAHADDGWLLVEVEDTGIGIAPEDLPYIFGSFYRADKARSDYSGGAGLGLAIARRIVEMHRGYIEVESTPGGGSLFRVRLPVTPDAAGG